MIQANRIHLYAVICSSVLLVFLLPRNNILNLFQKNEFSIETLFSFKAGSEIVSDGDVHVISQNILQNDNGEICLYAERGDYFAVQLPPSKDKILTLSIDCNAVGKGTKQKLFIENLSQGKSIILSKLSAIRNHRFDLTPYIRTGEPCVIGVSPATAKGSIQIRMVLIRQTDLQNGLPPIHLVIVFLCFILLFSHSLFVLYKKLSVLLISVLFVHSMFLIGWLGILRPIQSPWYWLFLICVIVAYRAVRKTFINNNAPYLEWVLIVFLIALVLRWQSLQDAFLQPLRGDAYSYKQIVHDFSWRSPFNTGIREPLYIWLQSLVVKICGPHDYQFRFLTIFFSLGIVCGTFIFTKYISGKNIAGLCASFLIAISSYAVFSSARGERLELFVFLMLLYCLVLLSPKSSNLKTELCAGALAGSICLTWLYGITGVTVLYMIRVWCKKIKSTHALSAALLFLLIITPCLFSHWKLYGDPFISINAHANFYRNAEIDGTPSSGGGTGSWTTYLIKERGIYILLYHTIAGYFNLFLNPFNSFNKIFLGFHYSVVYSYFFFPFYITGIVLSFLRKQAWIFFILFSFTNISPYLINEFRDPRLLFFVAPFFAFFWGTGVEFYVGKVKNRHTPKSILTLIIL